MGINKENSRYPNPKKLQDLQRVHLLLQEIKWTWIKLQVSCQISIKLILKLDHINQNFSSPLEPKEN